MRYDKKLLIFKLDKASRNIPISKLPPLNQLWRAIITLKHVNVVPINKAMKTEADITPLRATGHKMGKSFAHSYATLH